LIKKRRTLTIFDVPPKKLGIYYLLNNPYNIYTLDYCKKFVEDIIRAIPESIYRDTDIIFKIKREYKNIHPLYKKYINEITSHKNIKLINDISPESVIDISDATISIPFTSTAITSLRKGKHSIYYDPSEKLSKNNCLENEVKLVTSFKELENWITDCFEK
jgi:polysaccharide biosynthesis PFTS motif protein